jgi:serine/threonine-protein kinase RsbW
MAREAQLQLLSSYETIELAEAALNEVCEAAEIHGELRYWAGMALREALANAIKHGNKLNPDKRVHVEIVAEPHVMLRMIVDDEGEGFDPASLGDPREPENVLRTSGRGIFYIRHFVDEVRFATAPGGGTRIELVKNLNSTQKASLRRES